jgi:hypothetical protein
LERLSKSRIQLSTDSRSSGRNLNPGSLEGKQIATKQSATFLCCRLMWPHERVSAKGKVRGTLWVLVASVPRLSTARWAPSEVLYYLFYCFSVPQIYADHYSHTSHSGPRVP